MTWDTFLTLRGTKVIYLDHIATLRPSKSYGWGGVVGRVAIDYPRGQIPLSLLIGAWALDWDLVSGVSISPKGTGNDTKML